MNRISKCSLYTLRPKNKGGFSVSLIEEPPIKVGSLDVLRFKKFLMFR